MTLPEGRLTDVEVFNELQRILPKKLTQGVIKLVRTLGTADPEAPIVWTTPAMTKGNGLSTRH